MLTCCSETVDSDFPDQLDHPEALALARILIIEAPPASILKQMRRSNFDHDLQTASTARAALERIFNDPPDVIVLDAQFADRSALELHLQIRRVAGHIPVVFVSRERAADAVIKAMQQGAHDFLFMPIEDRVLQDVIARALEVAPRTAGPVPTPTLSTPSEEESEFCGASPAMREVYKMIGLVSGQDVNVLITGESGTGKEVVARAIHRHSARSDGPFLALNCAAIPENLLESELFGHEKGAFSGADRRRIGKFEQCDGGTILLDEIGDMPLSLQAKILRLLQEQKFERIGGNETIKTNVRVIASTHRDLKTWAATGRFRADLFYRLSVIAIHLPPLRERGEDLPMLICHFLLRYGREMGKQTCEVAPDAMERLRRYDWPGNIRELQSVLKQALLQAKGSVMRSSFLPELSVGSSADPTKAGTEEGVDLAIGSFVRRRLQVDCHDLYAVTHGELDRFLLAKVLEFTAGSQHRAASLLGIARQTLRFKLRELGMRLTQSVETDEAN